MWLIMVTNTFAEKLLVKEGAIFRTTSDTETIVQLIAKSKREKFIDKLMMSFSNTRRLLYCFNDKQKTSWRP